MSMMGTGWPYSEVHHTVCGVFTDPSLAYAWHFCKLAQHMGFILHALGLYPLGHFCRSA